MAKMEAENFFSKKVAILLNFGGEFGIYVILG